MRRLIAAATMSVALLGACSDSTGPGAVAGTYTLATIDGGSLPQVIDQDPATGATLEITAGTVILNEDGSFSDRTDVRITQGTSVTTDFDVATGVWNQSGNTITFTTDQGDSYSMTLSGRTLTQIIQGFTLRYNR